MFSLRTRRTLKLAPLAFVALFAAFIFLDRPIMGITAIAAAIVAVFIIIAAFSVFIATRDKITTMSLLPVWVAKKAVAGKL
jgi:hypothetical protein